MGQRNNITLVLKQTLKCDDRLSQKVELPILADFLALIVAYYMMYKGRTI